MAAVEAAEGKVGPLCMTRGLLHAMFVHEKRSEGDADSNHAVKSTEETHIPIMRSSTEETQIPIFEAQGRLAHPTGALVAGPAATALACRSAR